MNAFGRMMTTSNHKVSLICGIAIILASLGYWVVHFAMGTPVDKAHFWISIACACFGVWMLIRIYRAPKKV